MQKPDDFLIEVGHLQKKRAQFKRKALAFFQIILADAGDKIAFIPGQIK
jgi:hypothetical protein